VVPASNLRALSLPAFSWLFLSILQSFASQMGSFFLCANNDRVIPRPQFFMCQGGSRNSTQWKVETDGESLVRSHVEPFVQESFGSECTS
jgi:hypothetical protein